MNGVRVGAGGNRCCSLEEDFWWSAVNTVAALPEISRVQVPQADQGSSAGTPGMRPVATSLMNFSSVSIHYRRSQVIHQRAPVSPPLLVADSEWDNYHGAVMLWDTQRWTDLNIISSEGEVIKVHKNTFQLPGLSAQIETAVCNWLEGFDLVKGFQLASYLFNDGTKKGVPPSLIDRAMKLAATGLDFVKSEDTEMRMAEVLFVFHRST
ncbi:hypothetical protein CERZMDRAFT_96511 [Cercospora zeae-maydis SCOH1-5]|uniref:Uncharacterized protein n=1 Tax=Cercospora zeae-maydis SCOH1-5 TaxID=717836 RepID=A0A6A6FK65_9PEZI|nr:hypothetical protein CERZMDRAFT_96511 [Cercospora zeae-maydis SCOH1-5]